MIIYITINATGIVTVAIAAAIIWVAYTVVSIGYAGIIATLVSIVEP